MYALNLDENGRVLSACPSEYAAPGQPIVAALPAGNIYDYRYVSGEYIHDPLPAETSEAVPSQLDRMEAQIMYTALMTDTLIEGEA